MTRKKKLALNMSTSLLFQIASLICGFILPRLFLQFFGSSVNGLATSIAKFLAFISLAECGVGAVVQSALYKPLAEKNEDQINKIIVSADRFFKKIAFILVLYTAILMLVYPLKTIATYDYSYTASLILIISISNFAQYYFGLTYRLLLSADQLSYIHNVIHTATIILNVIGCFVLIKNGASIHTVKLTTSLIFLVQPILISVIAKKRYNINRKIKLTEEPIKQKWNGLAQHISSVVLENTDTLVLTFFSTFESISVYSIYFLVVNGVKQVIISLTNGMQSLLGNMLAKKETEKLYSTFDNLEWLLHTVVSLFYSITLVLIVPFVSVYTANITDTQYIVPTFACLITLAQASYCIRLPYNMMILAAGHYRQTQLSAIIEACINIVLSVVLVFHFGLIGVAIGTLVAMTYRTIYFVLYLSKNILYRKTTYFVKHFLVDIVSFLLVVIVYNVFSGFFALSEISFFAWFTLAVKTGILAVVIFIVINAVFYNKKLTSFIVLIKQKLLKQK